MFLGSRTQTELLTAGPVLVPSAGPVLVPAAGLVLSWPARLSLSLSLAHPATNVNENLRCDINV